MNAVDRGLVDELQLRAASRPRPDRDLAGVDVAGGAGHDQAGRVAARGGKLSPSTCYHTFRATGRQSMPSRSAPYARVSGSAAASP